MKEVIVNDSFIDIKERYILTHWQGSIELLRVLDGKMHCLINGKEYTVKKGDICIINKNQLHRIYANKSMDAKYQYIILEPSLLTADQTIVKQYIEPIITDMNFSHIISSSNQVFAKEIVNLMDAVEEIQKEKPEAYELLLVAYLHLIFQRLYANYKADFKKTTSIDINILLYQKMADFIYKNYNKKISLNDIADVGNVSRNKCCLLFKKYAQYAPIEFLNLYRLDVSCESLKTTSDSIISIALECGFVDQSYFNRLFLRRFNLTPKEYRKMMK